MEKIEEGFKIGGWRRLRGKEINSVSQHPSLSLPLSFFPSLLFEHPSVFRPQVVRVGVIIKTGRKR